MLQLAFNFVAKSDDYRYSLDWGNFGYQNKLTIGQFDCISNVCKPIYRPDYEACGALERVPASILGVDRLGDILNHPAEITTDKAITLPKLVGAVRVENLSFRYGLDGPLVLDHVI